MLHLSSAQVWPACNKGITQFYLLPCWYLFRLPTKGWPGWVEMGGWLLTATDPVDRELNANTVTHPSISRSRRQLTSLIETNYASPPL